MAAAFGQARRHRSCWCPPLLLVSRYLAVQSFGTDEYMEEYIRVQLN